MIIYARSPYFIEINEASQLGSRVELFIWNNPDSEPSTPTYTFTKSIASATNRKNVYNIAPYIKEYIEAITPSDTTDSMLALVKVKRYKEASLGSYTLLDTTTYYSTNGYTNYSGGYNQTGSTAQPLVLANTSLEYRYEEGITDYPFVNVWAYNSSPATLTVSYKDLRGRNEVITTITRDGAKIYKVPLRTSSIKYNNGNTCTINWKPTGEYIDDTFTINVMPICEPKFNPIVCQFINRYGGWQFLTFFKAKTTNIQTQGTTYSMLPNEVNYNPNRALTKSFNINGGQTIRLNTGWVPENYSELIQDLLLAETILLDGVPVEVKTTATDLKSSLKDRNINYEIEFNYAFNLINTVV